MARIIVSDCEKKEKSLRKQEVVKATYSVNTNEGLFQIETYGSSSRQNPDSASQTFQIDKDSAQQLIALLEKELFLQKSGGASTDDFSLQQIFYGAPSTGKYLPYLTALRTKPFMLLAGISGTGKSRIVREMAKACWTPEDDEYWKDKEKGIRNNCPKNFCMVQVKPNWHDSSELFGYVSRISGKPEFVAGDFLKFLVKAWEDTDVPYFLCLDEMNLAPVEQYFAEYLSVIESRNSDGNAITTDPIFKKPFENESQYGRNHFQFQPQGT